MYFYRTGHCGSAQIAAFPVQRSNSIWRNRTKLNSIPLCCSLAECTMSWQTLLYCSVSTLLLVQPLTVPGNLCLAHLQWLSTNKTKKPKKQKDKTQHSASDPLPLGCAILVFLVFLVFWFFGFLVCWFFGFLFFWFVCG